MITFFISFVALVLGYLLYGKFVSKVFAPDDRKTPAVVINDGIDYVPMPNWKIFMIQFLNIAGTGPIFGAIMGAKFGPAAYLWIILGCIFAGATHDFFSGMLSMRNNGADLPALIGKYLGKTPRNVMLVFCVVLLIMVGTVFVYSPAEILGHISGGSLLWIIVIFAYYVVATMLPIDKIIGKIYPIFSFSLLFMAVALIVVLLIKMPVLPELWDGLGNMAKEQDPSFTDNIFPCLFITIACGAISGFHATQSPLMARCLKSEKMGRPIFYGSMITEGLVALVWATVAMWFFYDSPTPGYEQLAAAKGFHTSAPMVVTTVCQDWLGILGGVLAILGVVAAPITSGDTAFRSARLIVASALKLNQKPKMNRLYVCLPIFVVSIALLAWQSSNPDGFNVIWQYFGWSNQTLSVFTLWAITVYLVRKNKPYVITLLPALFMTGVCSTYLFISKQAFGLQEDLAYYLGILTVIIAMVWFVVWIRKYGEKEREIGETSTD
ncbi:carbon starvation CstA family protein [Prevotella sp. CAG:592]|uniref:carbon starvation CstA family protein n=1 Tax=Prevotella sp. CAG:592 TaxID=1262931 RepID=UPI00033D0468|nr:carbon starvation protein A [Prevotella sp. CAG:592]CDD05527.1 putative carbon starvation protein A [Prevotella sp. CAG:592]